MRSRKLANAESTVSKGMSTSISYLNSLDLICKGKLASTVVAVVSESSMMLSKMNPLGSSISAASICVTL